MNETRFRAAPGRIAIAFVLGTVAACNGLLSIPEVERSHDAGTDAARVQDASFERAEWDVARDAGVLPDADAAPPTCASTEKVCGGVCVATGDPATGCGASDCNACAIAHARAACAESQCAIAACDNDFADCNGAREDGCEVHLAADAKHCSKCGNACTSGFACTDGACGCTTHESCGHGGICFMGFCYCDETLCARGKTCTSEGNCDD